jgi:hypothetical protein
MIKQSSVELNLCTCRTSKQEFLQQWYTKAALIEFITLFYSGGCNGSQPFALETMRRMHFMQQQFGLSDRAMNELLGQRSLLLKVSSAVDATLIAVSCVFGATDGHRAGKRKKMDKENKLFDELIDRVEKIEVGIRPKVVHTFQVTKRQHSFAKVRYRGLKKNTWQLKTLFALESLQRLRQRVKSQQAVSNAANEPQIGLEPAQVARKITRRKSAGV